MAHIISESSGPTGRIVLNQGHSLNPLDPPTITECRQALEDFEKAGVFVVELTGAGRAFCAGANLAWVEERLGGGESTAAARYDNMTQGLGEAQGLIRALRSYPGLIVAAVNGPTAGGGVGLALAADITIAAKSAYFSLPFVPKLGLIPDLGAISILQERLGGARSIALTLLGARLSAEEAATAGLIWACCDDDELRVRVGECVQHLAGLPRGAALAAKELVRSAQRLRFDDFLAEERKAQATLFAEPETLATITKLLAERKSQRP